MRELTRLREAKGLSRGALAKKAGIPATTVNRIESGERSPNVATLEKLAAALEVEMQEFFPKAQAPLPFEVDAGRMTSLEPDLWQNYALAMADYYASLADKKAPIEKVEGWAEVCWFHAQYVVNVVETIDAMVKDGLFEDEDNEMLPLLKATLRMANQANRVIERANRGPDENVEAIFWEMVGKLNLTEEKREEILA